MNVQESDIFHCLKCGRMVYEPHGTSPPPACCQEPMVRAVTHVTKQPHVSDSSCIEREPDLEEYALLAEAIDLSNWCHSFPDTDASRYEELASRIEALYGALTDRFESRERGKSSQPATGRAARQSERDHLYHKQRQFLAALESFRVELRQGTLSFQDWAQVCDRLDSLTAAFRHLEEEERELLREAPHKDAARRS